MDISMNIMMAHLLIKLTIDVNTGGRVPPEITVRGTPMLFVPPDFDHLRREKRQNLVPKYTKIQFFPGLRPEPRWGSLQRSPRPPSWWGGGSLPPPQEPHPALSPSGLASSPTFWTVVTPMKLTTYIHYLSTCIRLLFLIFICSFIHAIKSNQ